MGLMAFLELPGMCELQSCTMCHTQMYVGCSINIRFCIELQPVLFLLANWTLIGTLRQVSAIVIVFILHKEVPM